jgi:tetratricopeptide (TPR) repeat protein
LVLLDEANAGDAAFVKHYYAEAEKHYKAELAEAERNGPENPLVQIALDHLGTNYMAWGRYGEAEAAYLRRITVAEKVYAKRPEEILPSLIDIAWLYLKQGRVPDAETYNRRALAIIAKLEPGEHRAAVAETEGQRESIEAIKNNKIVSPNPK